VKENFKPMTSEVIILLVLVGLGAGILSGLIGVGGGIIIVPGLIYVLGFSQQQAQGTSLGLLLLPVGIFAVINYYNKGNIDLKVVLIMSVAFALGGYIGSKFALSISQVTLRKIFGFILFYVGFAMLGWDKLIVKWVKSIF
jgi:uncharacterized membrane protein YfcA